MEWLIGIGLTGITGLYVQLYTYYRWSTKSVKEVRTEILTLRENDLKHLDDKLDSLTNKLFELARDK